MGAWGKGTCDGPVSWGCAYAEICFLKSTRSSNSVLILRLSGSIIPIFAYRYGVSLQGESGYALFLSHAHTRE